MGPSLKLARAGSSAQILSRGRCSRHHRQDDVCLRHDIQRRDLRTRATATSAVCVSRQCWTTNTSLLIERLDRKFGAEKTFFVFADTVAARSFKERNESHGWLGVRFQSQPRGQPSQIIIHVRLLDEANVDQQEALGVIGVNLLHGAFYCRQPEKLISSLQENLPPGRIEVDMIKFSGPLFQNVDNRLMSLQLVSQSLTDAVMFTADGETVQPPKFFTKKRSWSNAGVFDLSHTPRMICSTAPAASF